MHVDEKSLRGGIGRADLPLETIKRLACDGSLITVVEDESGTPLHVGRKQRIVSTPLKRALWSRDRGCTFPGCRNKRFVEAHHVHHWAHGGDTSLENLTLLCTHHHRLLHEGGFSIRRNQHGAIRFERPDGRLIPRGGYRAEDMLDDGAGLEPRENPSAEGWMLERGANPPEEVREPRAVYQITSRVRDFNAHTVG
jgi:HNH endonuclease